MKFEDLEVGMKVKIISGNGFCSENVGKIGHIICLDFSNSHLNVKVSFDSDRDDVVDWGNSSGLELVEDEPINSLEQQLLKDLIKNMEKALNGLDLESLETLSKVYQRIK